MAKESKRNECCFICLKKKRKSINAPFKFKALVFVNHTVPSSGNSSFLSYRCWLWSDFWGGMNALAAALQMDGVSGHWSGEETRENCEIEPFSPQGSVSWRSSVDVITHLVKQNWTKFFACSENPSGKEGINPLWAPMKNRAAILFMWASGGFPVAISNTVQPTLHMSDLLPYPVSLMTLMETWNCLYMISWYQCISNINTVNVTLV